MTSIRGCGKVGTKGGRLAAAAVVLLLWAASPTSAQPYELSWHTVYSGGTTLTGGPYRLSGTAGQAGGAGELAGGPYRSFGGFWAVAFAEADLSVTLLDAPDPVTGLQALTYTITVRNLGPSAATSLSLVGTLAGEAAFVSAGGAGWSCGEAAGVVTCTRQRLPVGPAPQIAVVVTAPAAGGTLSHTVLVDAAESDPVAANNSATEETTVTPAPRADFALVKEDGGARPSWGESLTYTITVMNNGPDAVAGALVEDGFPSSLSRLTWSCSPSAGSSCTASGSGSLSDLVSLPPGGTAIYTATGTVTPGTEGPIVNTATVTVPTGVHDPDARNNLSTVSTEVEDLIFADGFESGDLSAWSRSVRGGGRLRVRHRAAMAGTSLGLEAVLAGRHGIYVQDDLPSDERRYRVRFYFDPNRFRPGEEGVRILQAFEEAPSRRLIVLTVRRLEGEYGLRGKVRLDDGSWASTGRVALSDAPHFIELDWQRSSSPSAKDGVFELFLDGVSVSRLTGLANARSGVDFVRMGTMRGALKARGRLYFDQFESRRRDPIGPD